MLVIPAIDLKGGNCVRLRQGDMNQEVVYSKDPVAVAARWIEAGARRLHIIDLDGAVKGSPANTDIIYEVTRSFPDVPVQAGGGIRSEEVIQNYLNAGVSFVILGSRAISTPHFISDVCIEFPGHIIVSLDVKNGKLVTEGWSKLSHHSVSDLASSFEADGVSSLIFTDVSRDGMLTGLNIEATVELSRELNVPVIAAGGLTGLDEVRALCEVASEGIAGVVAGKALYEGTLDFAQAQKLADELCSQDGIAS